jgi:hypothetical protein
MTTKVTRDRLFFAFEPKLDPATHVEQGEDVRLKPTIALKGKFKTTGPSGQAGLESCQSGDRTSLH